MATFEEDLHGLEAEIEKLKATFDQYFLALSKIPPLKELENLDRAFRIQETKTLKSFANKFRLQTVRARFNLYKSYWGKIMQAIEDGTFVRGRDRVLRPPTRTEAPAPAAAKAPAAPAAAPAAPFRSVYDEYVRAKAQLKEDVSQLTYEKLEQTLKAQIPQLKQKYGAKDVEFKVVIEGGKAKLKAIPKL